MIRDIQLMVFTATLFLCSCSLIVEMPEIDIEDAGADSGDYRIVIEMGE